MVRQIERGLTLIFLDTGYPPCSFFLAWSGFTGGERDIDEKVVINESRDINN